MLPKTLTSRYILLLLLNTSFFISILAELKQIYVELSIPNPLVKSPEVWRPITPEKKRLEQALKIIEDITPPRSVLFTSYMDNSEKGLAIYRWARFLIPKVDLIYYPSVETINPPNNQFIFSYKKKINKKCFKKIKSIPTASLYLTLCR